MPARLANIELQYGLNAFYCPTCARPVLLPDEGLTETFCPHVAFIINWVGDWEPTEPAGLSPEAIEALEAAYDDEPDEESALTRVANMLPDRGLILTFTEPARGGGHQESSLTLGILFPAGDEDEDEG